MDGPEHVSFYKGDRNYWVNVDAQTRSPEYDNVSSHSYSECEQFLLFCCGSV